MGVLDELDRMSDERFLSIYTGLAQRGYGPLDGEVAKQLKFRPEKIVKLPIEKRAKRARMILQGGRNAELAYELFGSYLMKERKAIITDFLDAVGVSHEDGMIQDDTPPDAAKIGEAVEKLDGEHPPEDVTLYLAISTEHWPEVPEIAAAWEARG